MNYLSWNQRTIVDFSESNITPLYGEGYVFTRIGKGAMDQTRSVRIDLEKFTLSSENRRVLKKNEGLSLHAVTVPVAEYDWKLGKLAKDFYDTKFGLGIMSVQKVKEMLTQSAKSNFNSLFIYSKNGKDLGYAICHTGDSFLHYSYPFYDLAESSKDMGLGMMTLAIQYVKEAGMKYIYLGSLQRPGDTYKLQFEGLEWFDGKKWVHDIEEAKNILAK